DFTYVDDIVAGVLAVLDGAPPAADPPHRVYNIGNHRPEELMRMIAVLEEAVGGTAEKRLLPMQPGDVEATCADISAMGRDYGFVPKTPIEVGIPKFVEWLTAWRGRKAG